MRPWTAETLAAAARGFQAASVLMAGAELDVFSLLARRSLDARAAARRLRTDPRATAVLLDALAALGLLRKAGTRYRSTSPTRRLLAGGRPGMRQTLRHLANCQRRWAELARVVRSGRPARPAGSVLGPAGDRDSFIGAMHEINEAVCGEVVARVPLRGAARLLDVGGGSGTWTYAFLRRDPRLRATLFDLPAVLPLARRRARAEGFARRVGFAGGDYLRSRMPAGCDLAWLSAIVHQNSRAENRRLFRAVFAALEPGGRAVVRDIVMAEDRTAPVGGALFAVNMLVATAGGSTYTLRELRADLEAAGFRRVRLLHRDEGMHSLVEARKGA